MIEIYDKDSENRSESLEERRHSGERKRRKERNQRRRKCKIIDTPRENKKPLVVDRLYQRAMVCSKINSAIKPTCPFVSLFFVFRSRLRLTIRGVARERVHFYGRV